MSKIILVYMGKWNIFATETSTETERICAFLPAINLQLAGGLMCGVDETALSITMEADYVRVWK